MASFQALLHKYEAERARLQSLRSVQEGDLWRLSALGTRVRHLATLEDHAAGSGVTAAREAVKKAIKLTVSDVCNPHDKCMLPFMIHNMALCFSTSNFSDINSIRRLIGRIEGDLATAKKSQRVQYHYYYGRILLLNCDYSAAHDQLSRAFNLCHKDAQTNLHLILRVLVPLKMMFGVFPSQTLGESQGLQPLMEIAQAIKEGDIKQYRQALHHKYQQLFLQWGCYLTLESLKLVAYRNLLKKVFLLNARPGSSVIRVKNFTDALKVFEDSETDDVQAHCVLANLIARRYIAANINLQHNAIVFAPRPKGFPKLSALQ
eukprot:m.16965 g.16965  ORF g.16965 m.16965 type:complete len:318 (-) comp7284_c0_seq1:1076-2029(-)